MLSLAVPGHAGAATVLGAPSALPAGASAVIRLDAGDRSKACSLSATSGKTRLGPYAYSITNPIVSIAWRIPAKARSLTWKVRLRCASSTKKLRSTKPLARTLAVKGSRRGVRRLFNPGSVRFTTGARGKTYSGLAEPPYPEGGKGGVDCSPGVLDGSSYCTGYCTWYAYQQRPAENLKGLGNAVTWYERARDRGIPVGSSPQVGAIAWWDGTTSNPYGHVAYVTAVNGANVTIAEMNYVGWNRTSSRTLPRDGRLPGGYIYGGPAGGAQGPGTGPGAGNPGTGPAGAPTGVGTRLLGDVNADGRQDAIVMFRDSGTAMTATSLPAGGFGAPTAWSYGHSVGADRYFLGDANGDGRADLVAFFAATGTWKVSLSSGTGFFAPTDWAYGHGVGTTRQWVTDATGDGRADVVTFDAGSGDWYISASDGTGFQTFVRWMSGHGVGSTDQAVGDTNGDGRADAAVWFAGDGSWYVALSTGAAFAFPGHWSFGHGQGTDQRLLGDGTGDGKDDEVFFSAPQGRWYLGTSDGNGFYAPTEWAFGHGVGTTERFLGDVNGDARDDLVTFDRGTGDWWASLSSGSGFFAPQRWSTGHGAGS